MHIQFLKRCVFNLFKNPIELSGLGNGKSGSDVKKVVQVYNKRRGLWIYNDSSSSLFSKPEPCLVRAKATAL